MASLPKTTAIRSDPTLRSGHLQDQHNCENRRAYSEDMTDADAGTAGIYLMWRSRIVFVICAADDVKR